TRGGGVSRGGALPQPCPASRGAAAGSGLPGADAVQAAALLAGGGRVQAPAACGEAVGDRGAVLDGVVVVVLELGAHLADLQAQAADAGQHPAVGGLADGDDGVVAVGVEVGHLAAQQFGLALGVVDDVGAAGELDGRVVAGGHPLPGRGGAAGTPGAGDEGVVADDGEDDVGVALDRRPDRVGAGEVDQQVAPVAGEVGGHDEGRPAGRPVDAQLTEVVAFGEPGLPFGVVQGGVPGVDEHVGPPRAGGRGSPGSGNRTAARVPRAAPPFPAHVPRPRSHRFTGVSWRTFRSSSPVFGKPVPTAGSPAPSPPSPSSPPALLSGRRKATTKATTTPIKDHSGPSKQNTTIVAGKVQSSTVVPMVDRNGRTFHPVLTSASPTAPLSRMPVSPRSSSMNPTVPTHAAPKMSRSDPPDRSMAIIAGKVPRST